MSSCAIIHPAHFVVPSAICVLVSLAQPRSFVWCLVQVSSQE